MDDVIHSYTRKEAIADGVLIDVSEKAAKCGIRLPIAVTYRAWMRCVAVPPGVKSQDQEGRLWDVLWTFLYAIRTTTRTTRVSFSLLVQNDNVAPSSIDLRAVCEPGDDGEPVITIMLPDED